jgi:nicotinamidase-related amidase
MEGQKIPIHCVIEKKGCDTEKRISDAITEKRSDINHYVFMKNTFGSIDFAQSIARDIRILDIKKIVLIGLCTDICVISNALMLRAACPNTRIVVLEDLCAGSTPENHQAALNILRANCIDVEKAF